jgi:hypothetical protein
MMSMPLVEGDRVLVAWRAEASASETAEDQPLLNGIYRMWLWTTATFVSLVFTLLSKKEGSLMLLTAVRRYVYYS